MVVGSKRHVSSLLGANTLLGMTGGGGCTSYDACVVGSSCMQQQQARACLALPAAVLVPDEFSRKPPRGTTENIAEQSSVVRESPRAALLS